MSNTLQTHDQQDAGGVPAWLNVVRQKVETLRFGVVQIVVHDSKVVQIERTEKTRLDGAPGRTSDCT